MKLYMHPGSPNSRRARIAARLAKRNVDEVVVNVVAGENRSVEYLALNPMGKVPTLVREDGQPLLESHAIAAFLARGTPASPESFDADIRQWQHFDAAHFAPPLGTLTFQHLFAPSPDEAAVAEALAQYRRFAEILDKALADQPFLLGDTPTIADAGLAASLTYADMTQVPLDETPKLMEWRQRLEAMPAFSETRPPPR